MAAENSTETAPFAVVPGRPFLPGQSGNPGGRPKLLSTLVKEQTQDGAELVEFMVRVLRNKRQSMRLRMEAAAWLADRGFGKALQQMELTGADGGPMEIVFRYVNDWRSQREREAK
jgi:hypothetical protein